MAENNKISEYIENMTFKKKVGVGFSPDEVYEAICDLTSMYNGVLAESQQEVAQLRQELQQQQSLPRPEPPYVPPTVPTPADPVPPMPEPAPWAPPIPEAPAAPVTAVYSTVPDADTAPATEEEEAPAADTDARSLRHAGRKELLELLLESRQENEQLQQVIRELREQNRLLKAQLEDKHIKINKAGTLAEASLLLNGVVESTQAAAQQYLDNLQDLYHRETVQCQQKEEEAQQHAQDILCNASQQCDRLFRTTEEACLSMEKNTREACEAMSRQAKADIEQYWESLSDRMERFYEAHQGLQELMQNAGHIPPGGRYG